MTAANRYTTTELLSQITRLSHVPTGNVTFQNADFLALADLEIETDILEKVTSVRENYYLTFTDTAANASGVYNIPARAIALALDKIQLVIGSAVIPITRQEVGNQFSTLAPSGGGYSFILENNQIVVTPAPTTGVVRQYFYRKPNLLIQTTAAAQVTALPGGNQITVGALPSTFTTATPLDLIQDQPGFDWLFVDTLPTSIVGNTLTFPGTLDSRLAVGDWLSLSGQTAVPQIPVEYRNLLAMRVAMTVCDIQGYEKKAARLEKRIEKIERALQALINPRVAEEPKVIAPTTGFLNSGSARRWRFPAS